MATAAERGQEWSGRAQAVSQNAKEGAARAFQVTTDIVWRTYRTLFSGIAEGVFPDHTRDAFFQLWCDTRTNTPKNSKWLKSRLAAFQPRTLVGYLAVSAFALLASAAASSILSAALIFLALSTYALIGISILAGLVTAFWMLVFSGGFFFISLAFGALSGITLAGYTSYKLSSAVLAYGQQLLRSSGTRVSGGKHQSDLKPPRQSEESDSTQHASSNSTPEPVDDATQHGHEAAPKYHAADHIHGVTPHEFRNASPSDGYEGEVANIPGHSNGTVTEGHPYSHHGYSEAHTGLPDTSPGRLPGNETDTQRFAANYGEGGPAVEGTQADALHPRAIHGDFAFPTQKREWWTG